SNVTGQTNLRNRTTVPPPEASPPAGSNVTGQTNLRNRTTVPPPEASPPAGSNVTGQTDLCLTDSQREAAERIRAASEKRAQGKQPTASPSGHSQAQAASVQQSATVYRSMS
ncbi:hypothetical protein ACH419_36885, partial [Streptomyces bobili]|uniref:hypothetical protein n=1 Tax=Streptomyces bobili TaxID=67280 RepID=UPI0037A3FD64